MSNMIMVPSSRPGFKSLPAELKVGGNNTWMRMRAQAPGYGGRRLRLTGFGELGDAPDDNSSPIDIPAPEIPSSEDWATVIADLDTMTPPANYSGPLTLPVNATSKPTPPSGYEWAKVLNSAGQTMGQILAISQGGGVTQLANGTRIIHGTAAGDVTGAGSLALGTPLTGISISTIVIFGGIGLLLFMVMQRGK